MSIDCWPKPREIRMVMNATKCSREMALEALTGRNVKSACFYVIMQTVVLASLQKSDNNVYTR